MTGRGVARRFAAILAAGVMGIAMLAGIARAQTAEDSALDAELMKLHQAGKYAKATEVAKRLLAVRQETLGPEHAAVGTVLTNLAELYRLQGRLAEAVPLQKRGLAVWEKALGPSDPNVSQALNSLALLYHDLGRLAEAEPLYKRSLALREKTRGPRHPEVAQSLGNLGALYKDQGRLAEAEPLFKRSLDIREKALGPNHPDVAVSLDGLVMLYHDQGRLAQAEPLAKRSLEIREKALGPSHAEVASALNYLAMLYRAQGRFAEAEPLFKRGLATREKSLGPGSPQVAESVNNLATLYRDQGRLAEAEPLYKRGLAIFEKVLGPDHPYVGQSLSNLAVLYRDQGRLVEAETPLKRSIALREKTLGAGHPDLAQSLNNLAELYRLQDRFTEAEPLYERSLAIYEKALGPGHANVALLLNNLALLRHHQSRLAEAEQLLKRSVAIRERALGPHHPDVAQSLNNLAMLHYSQDRAADAEQLLQRTLSIQEEALGPDHLDVALSLNNLAGAAFARGEWGRAADYWRRSTDLIKRRAVRGLARADDGSGKGEMQRWSWQYAALLMATRRLAAAGGGGPGAGETFQTAQWAQTSAAAASLAQMAARSATDSPRLASVIRERQDLVGEWHGKDTLLIAAKSQAPDKRRPDSEQALAGRLAAIDARLAEIDRQLAKDFPDYAALASPVAVSVPDMQAQLTAEEALVLFLDTPEWKVGKADPLPEESFIWVVTKAQVHAVRSDLGTAALQREVAALRCGLDAAAWEGTGRGSCAKALDLAVPAKAPDPLPFDHARAHRLYMGLFGQVRDLIAGKHLLIVPSGALTQLPFQVLVTESPQGAGPIAWLARSHAVTVLPAVGSLKALRRVGKPSAAARPMIGFGNPLLAGDPGSKKHAEWARLARETQRCPPERPQPTAERGGARGGVRRVEVSGLASLAQLKAQVPLPETAEELCTVAGVVRAAAGDIRLGAQATEREVKRLSAGGELAKYRMLHFATHGAVAGELAGASEPGLILTPPGIATEEDDGYLSASEIAALKLDADWVILSACNTAAGGTSNAEALSGLARAFIYAGARALLVSHWSVDSDATVALITGAIGEMAREPKVGRAGAMRRSMQALIDKGGYDAHPAYWAPFVVVGEGAAAQ